MLHWLILIYSPHHNIQYIQPSVGLTLSNEAPLELDPCDAAAAHGPLGVPLEGGPVPPELVCGLLVERVVGVGLQEEVLQSVHDRVDGQHCMDVIRCVFKQI